MEQPIYSRGDRVYIATAENGKVETATIVGIGENGTIGVKCSVGVVYLEESKVFKSYKDAENRSNEIMESRLKAFKRIYNNKNKIMELMYSRCIEGSKNSKIDDYIADKILEYTGVEIERQ